MVTENPIIKDIELKEIHSSGKCFAEINGKKVFFENTIPGETADIRIEKKRSGFRTGSLVKINKSSVFRQKPDCIHAGQCGGCNWMHIFYPYQLKLKKQILEKALLKYDINTPEIPDIIPSPHINHYRNKATYRIEIDNNTSEWALCFNHADTPSKPVIIENCLIQHKSSKRISDIFKRCLSSLPACRDNHFISNVTFRTTIDNQTMIIAGVNNIQHQYFSYFFNSLASQTENKTSIYYFEWDIKKREFQYIHIKNTPEYIFEKFENIKYRISPGAFFQPNPVQALTIYAKIKQWCGLRGNENVIDLYCGAGTIGCYIADKTRSITGIEGNKDAVSDAIVNSEINGFSNCNYIYGDILTTFNNEYVLSNTQPDLIILDPPRSGTLIEIQKNILLAAPARIIYLSCNPVSLAWNLKQLCEKYKVEKIQPFDMFPNTHHIETLVLLERTN